MTLGAEQIQAAAASMGLALDAAQAGLLVRYRELLLEWNSRFNLTAITEDEAILALHYMDSLTVLRALPPEAGGGVTLLDMGSGAGLPGIPLKIARPDLDVTLMDSTAKKVQFCEAVIKALQLSGIRAVKGRAEEVAHQREHREHYAVVVARALAPMPTLVEYLLPFLQVGGWCIAMRGSDAQGEAVRAGRAIRALGGELDRVEPVALPGTSDQRALVIMRKVRPTPALYPRQAGKPRSAPLLG